MLWKGLSTDSSHCGYYRWKNQPEKFCSNSCCPMFSCRRAGSIHSLFEIVSFTYNLWALVQNEPACLCIFLVEIVGVLATVVAGCGCGHFVPQLLPFYFVPCCSFPHFVQQSVPFYFVISLFSFPSGLLQYCTHSITTFPLIGW